MQKIAELENKIFRLRGVVAFIFILFLTMILFLFSKIHDLEQLESNRWNFEENAYSIGGNIDAQGILDRIDSLATTLGYSYRESSKTEEWYKKDPNIAYDSAGDPVAIYKYNNPIPPYGVSDTNSEDPIATQINNSGYIFHGNKEVDQYIKELCEPKK